MVEQRNFGLDLLRALAITLVLANHGFLILGVGFAGVSWTGLPAAASVASFASIEWLFVLSGFLIGTMMVRSFEHYATWWQQARSFWLRRWFRTLPNYYLFLGVNLAITLVPTAALPHAGASWRHAVFAQNLLGPEPLPYFFSEAWSLALDEWFYLLMPVLVGAAAFLARASQRHAFLAACAVLIGVPTLMRLTLPMPADGFEWDHAVRRVTLYHLDATGWGVLAAVINRWYPRQWASRVRMKAAVGLALTGLGIVAIQDLYLDTILPGLGWRLFAAWPRFPVAFGLSSIGVGTFLLFPWIASWQAPAGRMRRAVEAMSNYAYSVYLCHLPLLYLAIAALVLMRVPTSTPGLVLLGLGWAAATVAVSALLYHKFEKPIFDLRERFTRKVDASPFANPATPP